jgi:plastocyanin
VGAITVTASPAGSSASTTFDIDVSAPVSVTVTMENIAFNAPGGGDDVVIMLGDTVRWVNNDAVQHTATSTDTPAGGNAFDSGFLSQAQDFEFVPNTRGAWTYFCRVHPAQMRDARITVN